MMNEYFTPVDLDAFDFDTELAEVLLGVVVLLGDVEQCLRGNATNVQAGTTERSSLFNASGLQAKLSGLDSSNVT